MSEPRGERDFVDVVFMAIGTDSRLASLDALTSSELWNRHRPFGDEGHYIGLAIVRNVLGIDTAVNHAIHWLNSNSALLRDLDARIIMEFQTAIYLPMCCTITPFPLDLIQLLAEVGCQLNHQCSREFRPLPDIPQ